MKKVLWSLLLLPVTAMAQRNMEYLNRGVVAIAAPEGGNFVSWRSLVTDPDNAAFNVYRGNVKINNQPLKNVTWLLDKAADTAATLGYQVRMVVNGKEKESSEVFTKKTGSKPYLSIPLQLPEGYSANDGSVGDVDGDGAYEIILHATGRAHDNSHAGLTDPPVFQAYKMDGTLLWTINLGKNIREGAHYTQFLVYDLDGDGKVEVVMKTADGTMDALGNVIGDSTKDWRNDKGYILAGPEYLTVFDGKTGKAMATTNYIPARHPSSLTPTTEELKAIWGDGYGNRMDRFLACVAYLDGKHPSFVMTRGYYTRTVLAAWDYKDGKITHRWTFDSDEPGGRNRAYRGQGNHNLTVTDLDNDGKDEIVYGAMVIDDNGQGLYSTGLGHGDALHVTDLDPEHPGLEIFDIQERFDDAGASFRDARTGEILWKKASVKAGEDGEGPGRGLALDIDPRYPGSECWVAGAGITGLFDAKGNVISEKAPPSCNMGIYWDGDVLSELLNGTTIDKWDYLNSKGNRLFDARQYDCVSNNGTKSNPVLSADLFGDWREEVIYRTADNKELRIFTTTIPTDVKLYTLMQDPQYRLSIVWQNVGYNQPPHTGYHLGQGMKTPAKPNIKIIQP
ncbi:rhamnogalacturonan lyase [Chitinophaga sp. CB10]|uniref:rhamnogalacturonan lyase n=1 Tax=Chitinophaga sp. CB10 TaxID=1891659 RepID=UPI0025BA6536|nr:rhamnogalacturonan lyase [Chitinophaga sp. CB10]